MDHVDRILAQWRAARPDLDTGPMGLIGRLQRLSVHLMHGIEDTLAEYGLNGASFDLLATLRRAGAPFALSPSELTGNTLVTSGTITHRVDRLVKAGLVSRSRNPDDGRGFVITLTQKGFALIDTVVTDHVRREEALVAALSPAERQALDALLRTWLAGLEPPLPDAEPDAVPNAGPNAGPGDGPGTGG